MRPSPAESKWASKCSRSPSTQHACGDVPANHTDLSTVRGEGSRKRGVLCLSLLPKLLEPTERCLAGVPRVSHSTSRKKKKKSQTYMPYNHAIRQAKQILHNNTAINRLAHSPTILTCRTTPKPTTNSNTQNSNANTVVGLQTAPR